MCVCRLLSYFSYQWQDSDALIRANEIAASQLRNVNSGLQVRPCYTSRLFSQITIHT
jgi:hypothetical protein